MSMQNTSFSNRARVYNFMLDEVLPNPTDQGNFVTEEQIAERVGGMSRTPVREAFLLLGAEGFIQLMPRHGAFIPPVTRQEIKEILDLRALLEIKAASMVIESGRIPVAAMQKALAQQVANSGEGREREFCEWDTEFHLELVRASGNSLMTKFYADLRARQIRIGVRSLLAGTDRQAAVIAEHHKIIDGLTSRDIGISVAALQKHIETTRSGLNNM